MENTEETRQVGLFTVYPDQRVIALGEKRVTLSVYEWKVFSYLAERLDTLVHKDDLYSKIWLTQPGLAADPKVIEVTIWKVRRALDRLTPEGHHFLQTNRGLGYTMVSEPGVVPILSKHQLNQDDGCPGTHTQQPFITKRLLNMRKAHRAMAT